MADPKIRYDIEAGIKGEADVNELAQSVRTLGESLEGDLKQQAEDAANALQQLGAKRDAVAAFRELTNESSALAIELAEANTRVDALAANLPGAAAATTRLATAEAAARAQLEGATADFQEQRLALQQLREEFTGAARRTDAYREANAQLRVTVKDLRTNLAEKRAALRDAAAQAAQAAADEKKLATEYSAAADAAVRMRGAVQDNATALGAARTSLQSFGIQTENLAQAERNLETAIGQVRERVVGLAPAFAQAAQASNAAAQRQIADQRTVRDGYRQIQAELQRIQTIATVAIGGSFITGMIKDVADTADEFKNLQARIKLATGEGDAFTTSFRGVTEVALGTHSALEETGTLFVRLAKAGSDAGMQAQAAQAQALDLTTTINQAIQLSGSGAEASRAAITQLIQGLQSGVLRGEEFNSVMEQAPRLAQALAQGLGVTTGELRKLAEQGALTSATVIKALTSQSATVAAEFQKLPATVGRSLQNLQTQWTLYVGATDNGMASSANLARIIDGLAKNLDTLVATLYAAGKAWAAIKIAGLAADAYRWATATTGATVAVQQNTAAVAANTVAHGANAAAVRASAAAGTANAAATAASTARISAASGVLGRFSGLLGPFGVAVAALAPEFVNLGKWIGEGVAKLQGYGKALQDAEGRIRAQEEAAKANAAQQRAMAVALEEARNKQFQLTKDAQGLIAKFDEMRTKGDSAAEAIGKIGKDFDLASVPGIANAAAVLDKLAADGKLSAQQFQDAWSQALSGQDLAVFETNARAAFAGATREGERLAAMLDGTAREAIRRTGLEYDVLAGGIGKASRSAINDTDAIIQSLDRLKAQGVDTAQALTASLSKGIQTADSQRAVDALRGQIERVRTVLGDRIADGLLQQAAQQADELRLKVEQLKPGIQSAAEAMRFFGLQSAQQLKVAADNSREAYDALKNSGLASANQLREAFVRMANDAVAANKGIAPSWLQTEDAILRSREAVEGFGRSTIDVLDRAGSKWREYGQIVRQEGSATPGVIGPSQTIKSVTGDTREQRLAGQNAVDNSLQFILRDKLKAGTLEQSDLAGLKNVVAALKQNAQVNADVMRHSAGAISLEGLRDDAAWQSTRAKFEAEIKRLEAPARDTSGKSTTHKVDIKVGGEAGSVGVNTEDDAKTLVDLLQRVKGRSS
ncbi:tape measure protein [Variovorax boronicumulans]|uniref:tape measure protein n=1 Tax=Variovorax boronicumulans TaxID=436515 RepID=UPI0036F3DBAE